MNDTRDYVSYGCPKCGCPSPNDIAHYKGCPELPTQTLTQPTKKIEELEEPRLVINNPRFRCPICKSEFADYETLKVTFEELRGDYCMRCWIKWISENVPKLEIIKEE